MKKQQMASLKSGASWYKTLAIITAISGFFWGIIAGNVYKKKVVTWTSSVSPEYNMYEEEFNTDALGVAWGSTVASVITLSFMYSVCYRLNLLIEKKDK